MSPLLWYSKQIFDIFSWKLNTENNRDFDCQKGSEITSSPVFLYTYIFFQISTSGLICVALLVLINKNNWSKLQDFHLPAKWIAQKWIRQKCLAHFASHPLLTRQVTTLICGLEIKDGNALTSFIHNTLNFLTLEASVDKVCVLGVWGDATFVVVRLVSGLCVTWTRLDMAFAGGV